MVQGTQFAAALFDVAGCFEALSKHPKGAAVFFFFFLVQAYIRFDTDTNTHSGIGIHLHTVICMRGHMVIGTHFVSGSGLFHTRAETYNVFSGFILHGEK